MTQRAGDGSVDCLTAVPAGHGEGQGGGVMDERRGRRPLKGGLTSRMRRIRPRLSSITVAASSYPGPPTGASYRCRWDPPRRRHSTPLRLLRSDSEGLKTIRLLRSPRVRSPMQHLDANSRAGAVRRKRTLHRGSQERSRRARGTHSGADGTPDIALAGRAECAD